MLEICKTNGKIVTVTMDELEKFAYVWDIIQNIDKFKTRELYDNDETTKTYEDLYQLPLMLNVIENWNKTIKE